MAFTLAFEGDITKFNFNVLGAETVFGIPDTAGIGNEFVKSDIMREALEIIAGHDRNGSLGNIAQKALDEINGITIAELKASD